MVQDIIIYNIMTLFLTYYLFFSYCYTYLISYKF